MDGEDRRLVALGEYNNNPMFVIDPDGRYPFSFGLNKAKKLLEPGVLDALKRFVESGGKSIDE